MFREDEYSADLSLLKKCRYEEEIERDVTHVRPQEDLLPSLGQQVGATVHHFQIIPESAIPASFARLTGPMEPPKRPFIAAILAVLVQAFILEYCGIIIPPSCFDFWFNLVMGTRLSPVSCLWLDAKVHIARCFAQNSKVFVFGQGIIGEQFKGLQKLRSLCEGVEWMVHTSTGFKPLCLVDKTYNSTISADFDRDGYLWRIWIDAFTQISSTIPHLVEQKVDDAKLIFTHSVERVSCLASQIIKVFEGNGGEQELRDVSPDILLLFGGTIGEYAAICFFSALRFSLSEYFSGVSTTKLVIEHSSDIMATLLCQFVSYYTFLTPCKRHQNLFDECQRIWRHKIQKVYRVSGFSSETTGTVQRTQNHASFVSGEAVIHNSHTHTSIISGETLASVGRETLCLPLFSQTIYSGLYCFDKRTKLADCIQLQAKIAGADIQHNVFVMGESCELSKTERFSSFWESSESDWALSFDIDWRTLELPPLEEETEIVFQKFLRSESDGLAKQAVYKASESVHDTDRLA